MDVLSQITSIRRMACLRRGANTKFLSFDGATSGGFGRMHIILCHSTRLLHESMLNSGVCFAIRWVSAYACPLHTIQTCTRSVWAAGKDVAQAVWVVIEAATTSQSSHPHFCCLAEREGRQKENKCGQQSPPVQSSLSLGNFFPT